VVLGSEFRAILGAATTELSQRLEKLRFPKVAEPEWKQWEEFVSFASAACDFKEGKSDSTKVLKRQ
jgi:hypothetical protein